MKNNLFGKLIFLCLLFFFSLPAYGENGNSITFDNKSGDETVVKLLKIAGNSEERCGIVEVPHNGKGAINDLAPGEYYIVVKYENPQKGTRYGRGDRFKIEPPAGYISVITITLHPVAQGSYHIDAINKDFFNAK